MHGRSRWGIIGLLPLACSGGAGDPAPVGDAVSDSLVGIALVSPVEVPVEYELYQLVAEPSGDVDAETCRTVQSRLDLACDTIATTGLVSSCTARAAYFLAHVTPRCAGRVELVTDWGSGRLSQVFAFDLSGPPGTQPPAECGDGVVDDGEACDDGNRDDFDGCDANCFAEPFNGCEAVIQAYYQQAQIAVIDQDEWLGPRSHMMVHDSAQPMRAVDREMCNAALATATDVCNELAATMPFVASCSPSGALWQDDAGNDACSVRFTIGFHSVDPLSGVYTTSLPGILAFTLRSAASASDRAVEL